MNMKAYSKENLQNKFDENVMNFSNGKFVKASGKQMDVFSPINGEVIAKFNLSTYEDLDNMIKEIKSAQEEWASYSIKKRTEILYNYRNIIKENFEELVFVNHLENGKCLGDARAGITKAIETLDYACSLVNIANNNFLEVSTNVHCFSELRPLGIVSSITPFNFPVMVPHWTIAQAMVLGNAMILKPSELTPICAQLMAKYWKQAGLPDGIFNVINGDKEIVEAICKHPDIKAISFVGSTKVAEIVYHLGTANNKRVLALGGAKNHIVVLPDVEAKYAVRDIIASAYGMVGQRCMAASVIVGVKPFHIKDELVAQLKQMKVGPNKDWQEGLSPVISDQAVVKIKNYLADAEQKGAKILVDGRDFGSDSNTPNGYYIGPSLIDWSSCPEKMSKDEIFGPVLELIEVDSVDKAIEIQNSSPYGNAASVFTQNGLYAFELAKKFKAGMLGINIGVPVPREPFSFGGINLSKFGHGDITGQQATAFWTNMVKITMKWNPQKKQDWMS